MVKNVNVVTGIYCFELVVVSFVLLVYLNMTEDKRDFLLFVNL